VNVQLRELLIAYALAAAGMLAGAYFRWPVYSAMAMAIGVILWNLLRTRVFPAAWSSQHHLVTYYAALGLYVLLGFGLGLLMGRLTRPSDSSS
jgi:hypothetical protein